MSADSKQVQYQHAETKRCDLQLNETVNLHQYILLIDSINR